MLVAQGGLGERTEKTNKLTTNKREKVIMAIDGDYQSPSSGGTGWDFYNYSDKNTTAASQVIIRQCSELYGGEYRRQNLLKRDAKYRKGEGHSMIESFKWIPATATTRDNKTVDLAKMERDWIDGGYSATVLEKYRALITMVKTEQYQTQIWPASFILSTPSISRTEALLRSPQDVESGIMDILGGGDYAKALLASETEQNNFDFMQALRSTTITLKKKRWDGSLSAPGDAAETTVDLPAFLKYKCAGYCFNVHDFGRIRAQLQNNLTDVPGMSVQKFKILVSPNQYQYMIEANEKLQDKDYLADSGGLIVNGKLPMIRGFEIEANACVRDNEAFAYIPGVTVECVDWGTFTDTEKDKDIWTVMNSRRQYNYGVKLVQPLTLIQIMFTPTDEYPLTYVPVGEDGSDRVGDEIFDVVRDPKSVLAGKKAEIDAAQSKVSAKMPTK